MLRINLNDQQTKRVRRGLPGQNKSLVLNQNEMWIYQQNKMLKYTEAESLKRLAIDRAITQLFTMTTSSHENLPEKERWSSPVLPYGILEHFVEDDESEYYLTDLIYHWILKSGNYSDVFDDDGSSIFGFRQITIRASMFGINHYVLMFLCGYLSHLVKVRDLQVPDAANIRDILLFYQSRTVGELLAQLRYVEPGKERQTGSMMPALLLPKTDPLISLLPSVPTAYAQFRMLLQYNDEISQSLKLLPDKSQYHILYFAFRQLQLVGHNIEDIVTATIKTYITDEEYTNLLDGLISDAEKRVFEETGRVIIDHGVRRLYVDGSRSMSVILQGPY